MVKRIMAAILTTAMAASIFTFNFTVQSFASEAALTEDSAIEIALKDSAYAKDAKDAQAVQATENGAEIYKVTFYVGKAAITYRIDASGNILGKTLNNAPVAN